VWYEYFDLECVYTDVKGDTNTVGISKDTAWVEQWSREMSATEYLFEIVATPKEHHPAVREDSLYSVAKNCDLNLYAFRRGVEDEVTVSTEHTVCTDMTVKGSVLREWLRTGSRRSVVRVCTFLGDESVTEQEFYKTVSRNGCRGGMRRVQFLHTSRCFLSCEWMIVFVSLSF
jgi:hypothetical protein